MILTSGGRFAGYGLLPAQEGKPVFLWNLIDLETRIKWEGPARTHCPAGTSVEFDFKYDGLRRLARSRSTT